MEAKGKLVAAVLILEALNDEEATTNRSCKGRQFVWKRELIGVFNFVKERAIDNTQVSMEMLEWED